jgi:hypothetical protein
VAFVEEGPGGVLAVAEKATRERREALHAERASRPGNGA